MSRWLHHNVPKSFVSKKIYIVSHSHFSLVYHSNLCPQVEWLGEVLFWDAGLIIGLAGGRYCWHRSKLSQLSTVKGWLSRFLITGKTCPIVDNLWNLSKDWAQIPAMLWSVVTSAMFEATKRSTFWRMSFPLRALPLTKRTGGSTLQRQRNKSSPTLCCSEILWKEWNYGIVHVGSFCWV